MARHKGIGLALLRLWKAGYSAKLAQRSKCILPPRQKLVDIGLVPHVKNQPVNTGIVNRLNGHGELYNTQISRQMAACFGNVFNQKFPDFPAKTGFLRLRELQQIFPAMNILQNSHDLIILFSFLSFSSARLCTRPRQPGTCQP